MKKTAKKAVPAPKLSDLIKLDPEIQRRLNVLAKLNKTTKPQTVAMIINWYFTRVDSTAKQVKETRAVDKPHQIVA